MAEPDAGPESGLASDADLERVRIGPVTPHNAPITLADYDPRWPVMFSREAGRIRAAIGSTALLIAHAGSTSVPGLAAKPVIDIVLAVPDSDDEPAYVPALTAAGYVLRIREPDWFGHRLFKGPDTDVNLHVFTAGSAEIDRMLLFRDWLRAHDADRDAYLAAKRALAQRTWRHVQHYADAKSAIVTEILARAAGQPPADPLRGTFVVVSGPPASGKTTIARQLAAELGLLLIAKDTIKEALMTVVPAPDPGASRLLGSASVAVLLAVAAENSGGAVLEGVWHRSRAIDQLRALPGGLVEVFCRCDQQTARRRYARRSPGRAAGHHDADRAPGELWNPDVSAPVAGGWPVIEIDTTRLVDVPWLASRIRSAEPGGRRPGSAG